MQTIVHYLLASTLLFGILPVMADARSDGAGPAGHYQLGGQPLSLNGTGVRSKFFVKIYTGALYLHQTTADASQALDSTGAKSMQMVMLYDEVSAEKIAAGWRDGFKANLPAADLQPLTPRLEQFNALFPALHKGDRVTMDFVPGEGTTLGINGKVRGRIEGDDFFRALLQVWIGDHPADKTLKNGLLGN